MTAPTPNQYMARQIGDSVAQMVSGMSIALCNLEVCTDEQRHAWALTVLSHAERYIIETYCDGKDPREVAVESWTQSVTRAVDSSEVVL